MLTFCASSFEENFELKLFVFELFTSVAVALYCIDRKSLEGT